MKKMRVIRTLFKLINFSIPLSLAFVLLILYCTQFVFADVLILPAGTKIVEAEAFMDNTSLDKVILPEGLLRIGSKAFANSSVTQVYILSNATVIAEDAFDNCNSMTGVFSYVTPEQFGAKGDGVTDDTEAFRQCMSSSEKNIVLTNTYLIRRYLTTNKTKAFYAANGESGATIICNPVSNNKVLAFENGVTFENIAFYSSYSGTGVSPHGETYQRTSNIIFVEIWNNSGTFINCTFNNALTAIRGRKSTNSAVIPKEIIVRGCSFTECKSPLQGYCEKALVDNCHFLNDGDLYSGDHCIYLERYGCKSLRVTNCRVNTKNSDSGAAFQIYGSPKSEDIIPELLVSGSTINANGVASASAANVTIQDCHFNEQRRDKYIAWLESGSMVMNDSTFNHAYAFSYAYSTVKPYATNCTFTLMTDLGKTRCNFPLSSYNCTYVNWGGNVRLEGTTFDDCTFTRTGDHTMDRLYINNRNGYNIILRNTRFKAGDYITNNQAAISEYTGCSTF